MLRVRPHGQHLDAHHVHESSNQIRLFTQSTLSLPREVVVHIHIIITRTSSYRIPDLN